MKKCFYITAAFILFAALLYTLARLSVPAAVPQPVAITVQAQPPAPYPADFDEQLARQHAIKIGRYDESALPQGIPWTSGESFEEPGSPQAVKGGCFRLSNVGPFPANFLAFGSPAPQFFHYNLFDRIEVPLVRAHPSTGQLIPGLAEAWAEHGGWLWFKLQPHARYTNGRPVRAADFALGVLLRLQTGDTLIGSYAAELQVYGDSIIAIRPHQTGVLPHLKAAALLRPAEPGFYAEFGSDYQTRYKHRVPPGTGAYTVGKVQRGRLITLVRNDAWWAKDLPGFRYTCNADCIEHHFLTDEAQVWEMFLQGKLDAMQTRNIAAWQQYLEKADDKIQQHRFEVNCPLPPYGIALNAAQLPNIHLRRGLMQAMDMQMAIRVIFRGEAEQLPQFATGYSYLHHKTPQYQYNPQAARAEFAAAGYTGIGQDGILQREDGTRLSVRITFSPSQKISTLVTLLAQSAAACGVEIVPEPLPWQLCAESVKKKQHQMLFWATVPATPLPDYMRSFHSTAQGDDAPFCLNSADMDAAIAALEDATTLEQAANACATADAIIHEQAIWLPGWMENRVNIATWPHVHLPQGGYTTYDIAESHTYWLSD